MPRCALATDFSPQRGNRPRLIVAGPVDRFLKTARNEMGKGEAEADSVPISERIELA
jgi:hypothetical protein